MVDTKQERRLRLITKRIQPVTSTVGHLYLYMFVWGQIKTGKTTFISTGPNPIMLLAEPGHMTIRYVDGVQVFPVDNKGEWIPPKWKDAWDFLFFLRHGKHTHKTVGIDSMSGLVTLCMNWILKDEEARDEMREPGTPDKRTWGRLATAMMEYIEELESVCSTRKMHLILTAHERQPREEDMEEASIVPDLTPAIRRMILKRPGIIAHTFVEESEEDEEQLAYGMLFRDSEILVGERVTPVGADKPWLPRQAFDVTIPKLIRRIERKKASGNAQ